jgi:hypothetical protein
VTFDRTGGEIDKRDGMDRAERHAEPYWWQCMLEAAKAVAQRKPYFFSDDVVRWCREHHPNVTTHEPRAIGPLLREACRLGYAEKTQDYVPSEQRQCHSRPMLVWYSLIYTGPRMKRPRKRKINDPRQIKLDFGTNT